ncbi:hypothetical protein NMY22_g7026 [Coprinellus aureogranulatus]|nr:hypothetical protein NMY22_g7026 [Coprinellus aureogranulatus]
MANNLNSIFLSAHPPTGHSLRGIGDRATRAKGNSFGICTEVSSQQEDSSDDTRLRSCKLERMAGNIAVRYLRKGIGEADGPLESPGGSLTFHDTVIHRPACLSRRNVTPQIGVTGKTQLTQVYGTRTDLLLWGVSSLKGRANRSEANWNMRQSRPAQLTETSPSHLTDFIGLANGKGTLEIHFRHACDLGDGAAISSSQMNRGSVYISPGQAGFPEYSAK